MRKTLVQMWWENVFGQHPYWTFTQRIAISKPAGSPIVFRKESFDIQQLRFGSAAIAAYLLNIGIQKGDRIAILDENSPAFDMADFAIQTVGAVLVPIHANTDTNGVSQILKGAGVKLVFSGSGEQLAKVRAAGLPNTLDVSFDSLPAYFGHRDKHAAYALSPCVEVSQGKSLGYSFAAWVKESKTWKAIRPQMIDDLLRRLEAAIGTGTFASEFCIGLGDLKEIAFTSGTSGTPKGCMITHGNVAAKLEAMATIDFRLLPFSDRDGSALPRTHVFGRLDEMGLCVANGISVLYSSIDKAELVQNMAECGFTQFCGVPQVLDGIHAKVAKPTDGIAAVLARIWLWNPLLNVGVNSQPGTKLGDAFDRIVFDKIRKKLGGHLRLVVTGGGCSKPATMQLFARLGPEVIEGYGATETTSACIVNRPSRTEGPGPHAKIGSVGKPLPGVEVRIVGYDAELGGGELQIRGEQVFKGYWQNEAATAEVFDGDWYRSGDLATIDEDGFVIIKGRISESFKLDSGKYVNNAIVEEAFSGIAIIGAVVAEAWKRKFATALVFVNPAEALRLVGRPLPAGVDEMEWLVQQPELIAAVEKARSEANKKLQHWEQIQYVYIVPLEANEKNGVITDTKKVRSKLIRKRYMAQLDELYRQAEQKRGGGSTGGGATLGSAWSTTTGAWSWLRRRLSI